MRAYGHAMYITFVATQDACKDLMDHYNPALPP